MSVQVSYKKQTVLGIIGITILLLVIEVIANVWWVTQISCEFERNEIFENFDEVEKRQLCQDFYNLIRRCYRLMHQGFAAIAKPS